MRTIDADALERKLMVMPDEELCEDCCYNVINEIDEMPTVGGWISVTENLPKVSGHYLVSCVNNKTGHRWEIPVNAEWLTSRHDWYIETANCLASAACVTVTHYMPLPEPPKECDGE